MTTQPTDQSAALELDRATVGYADHAVVHGVDLTINRGEVVALLGANGSGKTTLVRGVLGLADLLGGRIEVLGQDTQQGRDGSRTGYVPQRHTVAGAVPSSVREVVSSGRLPRLGLLGRLRRSDREAVDQAIAAVDLSGHADTDVGRLSGGQQRRVLIARALASEPELLLMDEPTAGVDRASQRALVATFGGLAEAGMTLVVVTHEVGPLVPLVDRVVLMDEGRITYDGPWETGTVENPTDGQPSHAHATDDAPDRAGDASILRGPLGGRA